MVGGKKVSILDWSKTFLRVIVSKLICESTMDYVMARTSHSFVWTFHLKDGSVAVIEDSILEVLKQANKPRVLFLKCFNTFLWYYGITSGCFWEVSWLFKFTLLYTSLTLLSPILFLQAVLLNLSETNIVVTDQETSKVWII